MRITDVRPVLLTHPYGNEPEGRRSACFVEVETDAWITGVGETHAGAYVSEITAPIVELFKPLIVGQDPWSPEAVYRVAYRATSYFGRTGLTVMVLSATENALWDIAGKARGVPVHALLGGAVQDELRQRHGGGPARLGGLGMALVTHSVGYRSYELGSKSYLDVCRPDASNRWARVGTSPACWQRCAPTACCASVAPGACRPHRSTGHAASTHPWRHCGAQRANRRCWWNSERTRLPSQPRPVDGAAA